MSDETAKALINNLPAILGAVAAVVASIAAAWNLIRTGKLKTEVKENRDLGQRTDIKVDKAIASSAKNAASLSGLHEAVNGQTAQLLAVTGAAEHAKGVLQDRERSDAIAAGLEEVKGNTL